MHVVYEIACYYSFANESEQKQKNKTFNINNHCETQIYCFSYKPRVRYKRALKCSSGVFVYSEKLYFMFLC